MTSRIKLELIILILGTYVYWCIQGACCHVVNANATNSIQGANKMLANVSSVNGNSAALATTSNWRCTCLNMSNCEMNMSNMEQNRKKFNVESDSTHSARNNRFFIIIIKWHYIIWCLYRQRKIKIFAKFANMILLDASIIFVKRTPYIYIYIYCRTYI